METKLSGKKFPKFGYTSRGCLFLGNFVKYCSIRYLKLPIIQTGRFGGMESAQDFLFRRSVAPGSEQKNSVQFTFRLDFPGTFCKW